MSDAVREQPLPHGKGPDMYSLVIEDLKERRKVGIQRYGEALKAFNGRDALIDAYQEALDLVVYLKQELMEREKK